MFTMDLRSELSSGMSVNSLWAKAEGHSVREELRVGRDTDRSQGRGGMAVWLWHRGHGEMRLGWPMGQLMKALSFH